MIDMIPRHLRYCIYIFRRIDLLSYPNVHKYAIHIES